jgi:predicted nucleic acid-binding Zn ribbon protein
MSDEFITLTAEEKRKRRARNLAIAWLLMGAVALFYVITIFKFNPFPNKS